MTPKEKAKELVDKFKPYSDSSMNQDIIKSFNVADIEYKNSKFKAIFRYAKLQRAKECALVCVDEVLSLNVPKNLVEDWRVNPHHIFDKRYWVEVKEEINKL